MRWFRRAVKAVADTVADTVNKAVDAVADAVETVGNAIEDGLSALGGNIPVVSHVLRWLGGIISASADLTSAVIKAGGSIAGGVMSGLIKILGGLFTLDWRGMLEGVFDIASGIAGAVIMLGGKFVAFLQVIVTLGRRRPLNDEERRLIRLVFRNGIAMYNVRVVDNFAGVFSVNSAPFVLGNTIHMKGKNASTSPALFIHECVHVWQNQQVGSRYAAEAVASQWWGVGYNWEPEANAGKDWLHFEREAQADFIEDIYRFGAVIHGASGNGAFFAEDDEKQREFIPGGTDHTTLANTATRTIRRLAWRLSGLFNGG